MLHVRKETPYLDHDTLVVEDEPCRAVGCKVVEAHVMEGVGEALRDHQGTMRYLRGVAVGPFLKILNLNFGRLFPSKHTYLKSGTKGSHEIKYT